MLYFSLLPPLIKKKLLVMVNEKDFKNMCKVNEFKECIQHPHVEDVYFERCKTYFTELISFKLTNETWKKFYIWCHKITNHKFGRVDLYTNQPRAISHYYNIQFNNVNEYFNVRIYDHYIYLQIENFKDLFSELLKDQPTQLCIKGNNSKFLEIFKKFKVLNMKDMNQFIARMSSSHINIKVVHDEL